jgi:hypothetical protein
MGKFKLRSQVQNNDNKLCGKEWKSCFLKYKLPISQHNAAVIFLTSICIPCLCRTLTAHLLASKSAIIFNVVSKVGTTLALLAFSFDFTNMGTDFVAKIK